MPVSDKRPKVNNWAKWRGVLSDSTLMQFVSRYPECDVALHLAASHLTVVDIDQPGERALYQATDLFGQPSVITKTQSGGHHFIYENNGELRGLNLRRHPRKLAIDVKCGNAISVEPSSRGYAFCLGNFGSLKRPLQPMRRGVYADLVNESGRIGKCEEGERNLDLFRYLRDVALQNAWDSFDSLLAAMEELGMDYTEGYHDPPLPAGEVVSTAKSVARYRWENKLMKPGESYAIMNRRDLRALRKQGLPGKTAALLFPEILSRNSPADTFSVPLDWVASEYDCSKGTAHRALKLLRDDAYIVRIKRGGGRRGNPSLYRLGKPR